jgi:hypothetical protein
MFFSLVDLVRSKFYVKKLRLLFSDHIKNISSVFTVK